MFIELQTDTAQELLISVKTNKTNEQPPQTNTPQTTTNKREHKKNKRQNWQGKMVMVLTA